LVNASDVLMGQGKKCLLGGSTCDGAGISEMLLQSHQGYIELLPALPDEWQTGAFKGFVARGNFVLDFAWDNGILRR